MRFRLVTYNIHRAIGVDRQFRPDRIEAILRHCDADVVLLQEVDWRAPRSGLRDLAADLARRLGYRHRAVGLNVTLRLGKYGNATLSRFPIVRRRNLDLTLGARKRRGALFTRLRLTEARRPVELDVFNIHLSLSAAVRQRQVRYLLQTHEVGAHKLGAAPRTEALARAARHAVQGPKVDASLVPAIIAGDTNDWRNVLRQKLFDPAGFLCITNRRPGSRWSIKTYPSLAPTAGLDKIFCRGPLHALHVHRSRLALARVASDHLPVIAELELLARTD